MSNSEARRTAGLIPGGYFLLTRSNGTKGLLYLVATSMVPAWWLLIRLADQSAFEAAVTFALGYVAFIAIYEIGYVANDVLDARRPDGRRRLGAGAGALYLLLFVAVRLTFWLSVGYLTGWLYDPIWLGGYAALFLAFALHDLITPAAPRSATFVQLAALRFILPITAALPRDALPTALLISLLLYVYLRWLSYLDSKGLLNMPSRRDRSFGLVQMVLLAPLLSWMALSFDERVILELWAWLVVLYLGWSRLKKSDDRGEETQA